MKWASTSAPARPAPTSRWNSWTAAAWRRTWPAGRNRPPSQAAGVYETLSQVRAGEPVPPARLWPQVPRDLQTICLKCLQKDPQKRYASAAALAEDLRRYRAGEPIVARPVGAVERAAKW